MDTDARVDGRTRDTRDRIRQAATQLFFSSGFAATSVREITAACDVTPGALYNHYASKEDILVDIYVRAMDEIDDLVNEVMTDAPTPSGRLAMLALSVTYYHAEHRERGLIVLHQANWLPERQLKERNDWFRGYRRRLERLLAEGVSAGEMTIPMDSELDLAPAIAAKALFDTWTQIGTWFRADGPVGSTEVARIYARLALQTVGAPQHDAAIDAACAEHLAD